MAPFLGLLFSPGTPLWVKIGAVALAVVLGVAALIAWWKQDCWQNLETPVDVSAKRKARPS